jgi:high-affinity iron transporter
MLLFLIYITFLHFMLTWNESSVVTMAGIQALCRFPNLGRRRSKILIYKVDFVVLYGPSELLFDLVPEKGHLPWKELRPYLPRFQILLALQEVHHVRMSPTKSNQAAFIMIAAFLISFREGLEAALIIGIIFGYLRKIGADHSKNRYVWTGVVTAILLSITLAAILQMIGLELEGQLEEIFEGITMLLAAGVLTWMIFWMRRQASFVKSTLEAHVHDATRLGDNWGLAAVAFISVFREGIETALFLTATTFANNGTGTLVGASLGLLAATVAGYLIFASITNLNPRHFFNVTSFLLIIFAAGLVAHGIHEFQEAGLLFTIKEHVWDTNALLDENSTLGILLKTLIGYNGNPSLIEVVGYWSYWGLVLLGLRKWMEQMSEHDEIVNDT